MAQLYGEQGTVVAALQVPAPLQVLAGVSTFPLQAAAAQTVPCAYLRQAPLPSQLPSVPQPAAPESAH